MRRFIFVAFMLISPVLSAGSPILLERNLCTLKYASHEVVTPLESPCAWVVNSDGSKQTLKVDNKVVAILTGKPINIKQEKEWGVTKGDLCSYDSIGVIVNELDSSVTISKPITDALVCSNIGVDHVFFKSYQWD